MASAKLESVDAYIAAQPPQVRAVLERIRTSIRRAVPSLTESISYQMPTYKLDGSAVIYFAAWKKHYSLYPLTRATQERFEADLAAFDVEKGTVRLPYDQPVPAKLIQGITRQRAREVRMKHD